MEIQENAWKYQKVHEHIEKCMNSYGRSAGRLNGLLAGMCKVDGGRYVVGCRHPRCDLTCLTPRSIGSLAEIIFALLLPEGQELHSEATATQFQQRECTPWPGRWYQDFLGFYRMSQDFTRLLYEVLIGFRRETLEKMCKYRKIFENT